MKQLKNEDKYPAELWDNTDAPAWDAERVWKQISSSQASVKKTTTYWWLPSLLLLVLLVASEPYLLELQSFPIEDAPSPPAAAVQQILKSDPDLDEQPTQLPIDTKQLFMPSASKQQPNQEKKVIIDSIQQHRPKSVPIAGLTPKDIPFLVQETTALPPDSRPGTKLSMRLPIPDAPLDSASYLKRLWVQFKRFNKQGDIDWIELGIQPNGDGTFSIIPADKPTEKQHN